MDFKLLKIYSGSNLMIISRENKICGQVSIKMIINTFFCERKMPVLACAVLGCSVVQPTGLLCPWGFSRQEHWSG